MIRFRPAAARELAADVAWYERDRVLLEPDVRSAKVARFPYRVVYVVIDDDIDVLAVAHTRRRPRYWTRRR